MSPIDVRWLIKGLGPGGAETLMVSAARLLDADRFRLQVDYLLPWKNHLVAPLEEAGVVVRCLGVSHPADPRWLVRFLEGMERVSVVHVHSPLLAGVVRPVLRARRHRPALVSTEHNVWHSFPPLSRLANRVTNVLDDVNISVSDEVARSMTEGARRRTEVLVHGVDLEAVRSSSVRRKEMREEIESITGASVADRHLVMTIANLRANKAYPDMLLAARCVADQTDDIDFVAIGQGPLEDELRARHAELGLGTRFRFLGYQPEAYRFLAAADVFTMASHHEGYPISVMEAMAAGLPVVATAVGGMPEAVRDGIDGRIVPPGAPEALAAALLEVLADEPIRRSMGDSSRARSDRFDMRRAAERIGVVYDQLGARR